MANRIAGRTTLGADAAYERSIRVLDEVMGPTKGG